MAGSPSTEERLTPVGRLRALSGDERVAVGGVAVMAGSLLLPWWGAPTNDRLVLTGISDFTLAEAAFLATAAAVAFLLWQVGGGYVPPRPLTEWALLVTAGAWAELIMVCRILDRPQFTLANADEPYRLRYGIGVAMLGAAAVVLAGWSLRRRRRAAAD